MSHAAKRINARIKSKRLACDTSEWNTVERAERSDLYVHLFCSRFLGTRLFASALYQTHENCVIVRRMQKGSKAYRRGGKMSSNLELLQLLLLHSDFPWHNGIKHIAHCNMCSFWKLRYINNQLNCLLGQQHRMLCIRTEVRESWEDLCWALCPHGSVMCSNYQQCYIY